MSEDVHDSDNMVDHLDDDPTNNDLSNLLTMERVDEDQQEAESHGATEEEVRAVTEEVLAVEPTPHQKFTQSLRLIADFYDAHPEITLPSMSGMSIYGADKGQLRLGARAFGEAEKEFYSSYFILKKKFGEITLSYWSAREQVCTKREVGKKYIEAYTPPPVEAHEEVVYEWDCGSLFSNKPDADPADSPSPDEVGF